MCKPTGQRVQGRLDCAGTEKSRDEKLLEISDGLAKRFVLEERKA